jgi:O-methyltransferase
MSKVPIADRITPELRGLLERHGIADHAESILKYSLLDAPRVCAVIRACEMVSDIQGDTAEIGCASGGTSRMIAMLNPGRTHYACDTFQGLMDADEADGKLKNGDFANHESQLEAIRERNLDLPNLELVAGYFPESHTARMAGSKFVLVHLDTDTYRSMADGFKWFEPLMAYRGVMILDDVIGKGTEGGKRFWLEMRKRLSGRPWKLIAETNPSVMIQFI